MGDSEISASELRKRYISQLYILNIFYSLF